VSAKRTLTPDLANRYRYATLFYWWFGDVRQSRGHRVWSETALRGEYLRAKETEKKKAA
jgi:hypothetical protein